MNPIFPDTPEPTERQRKAVSFGNEHAMRTWLYERPRTVAELKRAIIVEAGRPVVRDVLRRLLYAHSAAERRRITDAIEKLKHRKL